MQYIKPLKLIFIHIPKTGGSFIERKMRLLNERFFNDHKIFGGHTTIEKFKKKLGVDSSYKCFSVVRNPYNRIISAYN